MLTLEIGHVRALLLLRRRPCFSTTGALFSPAGGYVAFQRERRYVRVASDGLAGIV